MEDYLRLDDLQLNKIDFDLVRQFETQVFDKYGIPDDSRSVGYSRSSIGISPATKIFMFGESIYPYFIKVGVRSEVEKESRKYGRAVVRLPAFNIPPKEDFILGNGVDDSGQ